MKSQHLTYIIGGSLLGVILLLGVAYFFVSSLWFLAASLPQDGDLFLAAKVSSRGANAFIQSIGDGLPPEYPNPVHFNSLAISRKEDVWQVRGIVKLNHKNQAASELIEKGWNVRMQGPFISAAKGLALPNSTAKSALSSLMQGIVAVMRQSGQYPLITTHPQLAFLIGPKAHPLIDQAYEGVVTTQAREIVGYVKYGSYHNEGDSILLKEPQKIADNELKVSLQSKLLTHIPDQVKNSALTNIARTLGFIHQSPELVTLVTASEYIAVDNQAADIAIMILGDPDKIQESLRKMIETEESYQYPQKGAFRLPDGTLGFEMRPSKSSASWDQSSDGCGRYKGKIREWWVCRNSQQVAIGTNKDMTYRAAIQTVEKDTWQLSIGKSKIPLEIKHAIPESITVHSRQQEIIIRIK